MLPRPLTLAASCLLTLCLAVPAGARAPKPGMLVVPSLFGVHQRPPAGYVAPKVWVYDEVNTQIPSTKAQAAWDIGDGIEVPEGWYLVEVGNVQNPHNRAKVFVKSGHTTVIPTGLVIVTSERPNDQPRDICNRWDAKLFVSLPLPDKKAAVIGTNRTAGAGLRVGVVQVVAGYYRVQWNRFTVAVDIKANMALELPTGQVGPMPQRGYTLHAKKGFSAGNPGLRLCQNRPTRVLARGYWGTYNRQISQYPFKQRVWEQISVALPESRSGPYQKLSKPRFKGRVYKGPGSEPVLLWENPESEPPPLPSKTAPSKTAPSKTAPSKTAPSKTAPEGGAKATPEDQ